MSPVRRLADYCEQKHLSPPCFEITPSPNGGFSCSVSIHTPELSANATGPNKKTAKRKACGQLVSALANYLEKPINDLVRRRHQNRRLIRKVDQIPEFHFNVDEHCPDFPIADPGNPWEALDALCLGLGASSRILTDLHTDFAGIIHVALDYSDHYGMGHGKTLEKALAMAALQLYDRLARHPHILYNWYLANWPDGGGFYLKLCNYYEKYLCCGIEQPRNY